jgi:hypothetical protein
MDRRWLLLLSCAAGVLGAAQARAEAPGLLFYLSADKSLRADVAAGDPVPNFSDHVKALPGGAKGGYLETQDDGILTWNAARNIYAQRGTVAFDWRSRYPVGVAPFPIFRVGYADHTSWDMVWLRIDWNGHGFDAFVTDDNLARTRVSFAIPKAPAADQWVHLAFTWDETQGVRLYVDGKLAAKKDAVAVYDTGLDQFGFATRVVSPHQVQSRYNFMRGGDFDELRIYDQALDDSQIAALARDQAPDAPAVAPRDMAQAATRDEWWLRYGWNRPGDRPSLLEAPVTRIRKVEFADAKDKKEWMWKATDGIPETTWPGVYNRSRLPGRDDYFELPDWNTYVEGGQKLTLALPNEPFNHLEIQGAAFGPLTYQAPGGAGETRLGDRPKGQERTFNQFDKAMTGGVLTVTNIEQETPIQEIWAYDFGPGSEPAGTRKLSYTIRTGVLPDYPDLNQLNGFIKGRYPADEQSTVVALPDGAPSRARKADTGKRMPLVHVLIPYEFGASPADEPLYRSWNYGWENMEDALDGIAIDLPALKVKPTHGDAFPLNIQVKDPLWPDRNLMDVSVSVKPGEARTLWLDTRDRILPNRSFYLTIAGAGQDFDASQLDGAKIRLVFKAREAGKAEHIQDRLNQVKDNWGYLVEEHTASKREALYRRLVGDATDLFRVDPDNAIGRQYWADIMYGNQGPLPYAQPAAPTGTPLWAFRQLEDLKNVRKYINWWIDNRQVDYGDFGGGISDDTDLVEQWPGLALMGVDSEKVRDSQMRLADAAYKNGMFTNGLSTIVTDELHSYEEGINSNSEAMYINWGDPKVVERLMTTVKAYSRIIEVNPAGHLHFNTSWYNGAMSYREGPWEWSKYYSYLETHPGVLMGQFNADPTARKVVTGLADGILAHGKQGADGAWTFPDEINWRTDATRGTLPANSPPMQLMWASYRWTGDRKYLTPILASVDKSGIRAISDLNENLLDALDKRSTWGADAVKKAAAGKADALELFLAWQTSGDKKYLETLYGDEMRAAAQRMYMMTEGHWWSDRVEVPSEYLQRSRLGGIALKRNFIYPGHTVSWRFAEPEGAEQVAILVPGATQNRFKVIAFNTADHPIKATMTTWNVTAGRWKMTAGTDTTGQDKADRDVQSRQVDLERSSPLEVSFAPRQTTVMEFELQTPAATPPEKRPDIGIGRDDLSLKGRELTVKVHSLGAVDAPAGTVQVVDAGGRTVASAVSPPLKAPVDLTPKTASVKLTLPAGFERKGAVVRLALPQGVAEVTQLNNSVPLP